jgi:hypothetical protein
MRFLGKGRARCFNRIEEEIFAELVSFLPSFGHCGSDYFEQVRGIEWFVEKIDGTLIESSPSSFIASVGRYKDKWQVRTLELDATLQLDAIHSWHPNVGNHTSRRSERPRLQELFGGREHRRLVSGRLYQAL